MKFHRPVSTSRLIKLPLLALVLLTMGNLPPLFVQQLSAQELPDPARYEEAPAGDLHRHSYAIPQERWHGDD